MGTSRSPKRRGWGIVEECSKVSSLESGGFRSSSPRGNEVLDSSTAWVARLRTQIQDPRSQDHDPPSSEAGACTRKGCDSGKCFIGVPCGQRRVGVSIFLFQLLTYLQPWSVEDFALFYNKVDWGGAMAYLVAGRDGILDWNVRGSRVLEAKKQCAA